ncbi:MAG: hypothetical protein BGP24_09940 [Lysobacterales bacterium 69-70]|nr:MFS transporter [Xanthomonadaceae bacterium]ODU33266.1 MAG: hypothetical protein ABS97_12965 [Xanthomonadaceae bacterium SCN 69-320]ODV16613.1 MAG: hypothetical protein ABT27_19825 [Xanthomonadaceae bacterium SCN 69-25]OJZ00809.1 MAG: hypothetical protein BGP24_09940 [Xanthomonadales bacterium 69-70]
MNAIDTPVPAHTSGSLRGAAIRLAGAALASALSYGIALPVLPLLIAATGTEPADIARHTGWLMGVYTLTGVLTAPLWGRACDRAHPVNVLRIGLIGQGMALLLLLLPVTLPLLYLTRVMQGALAAAVLPAALTWMSTLATSEEARSEMFARLSRGALLGGLLGPGLGGWFAQGTVLVVPVLLASTITVIAFVLLPRHVSDARHRAANAVQGTPGGRDRSRLALLIALAALAGLAMGVYEVGVATRAQTRLDLDPSDIGMMFTGCGAVMLVTQWLVFHRGHDPRRVWRWVPPAFLLSAAGILALDYAGSGIALSLGVAFVAAGAGVLQPALTYWASRTAGPTVGWGLGIRAALTSLGQASGSFLGGFAFVASALGWSLRGLILVALSGAAWAAWQLARRWSALQSPDAATPATAVSTQERR